MESAVRHDWGGADAIVDGPPLTQRDRAHRLDVALGLSRTVGARPIPSFSTANPRDAGRVAEALVRNGAWGRTAI